MQRRLPVRVVSHDSSIGRWQMALRAPHPALRFHVRKYCGWIEHLAGALTRRELPTEQIPLIINFGSPIRVYDAGESERYADLGSFTTGAYDTFVRVRSQGPSGGIQVDFTILGARLFLGRPLGEMSNQSLALDDVLGVGARELAERLRDLSTWDDRFDLLDHYIGARLESNRRPAAGVECAWRRLLAEGGVTTIRQLADETGWSHKHLIDRFKQEIGLTPKTLSRILRFSRAARALRAGGPDRPAERLADLALRSGYYDQAHFIRDFRAFAGVTPGQFISSILPDGAGVNASPS